MSTGIVRQTRAYWMRIRRYLRDLHPQTKAALSPKTRMVKAEAIEALLYGCSTWTLRQEHYYSKLRTKHHHRISLRHHRGTAQETRPPNDFLKSCSRDHWMWEHWDNRAHEKAFVGWRRSFEWAASDCQTESCSGKLKGAVGGKKES